MEKNKGMKWMLGVALAMSVCVAQAQSKAASEADTGTAAAGQQAANGSSGSSGSGAGKAASGQGDAPKAPAYKKSALPNHGVNFDRKGYGAATGSVGPSGSGSSGPVTLSCYAPQTGPAWTWDGTKFVSVVTTQMVFMGSYSSMPDCTAACAPLGGSCS